MAKTAINVGSAANDGTGDPLRTAMQSTNSNFNELYALLGDGSSLSISGDVTMSAGAVTIANDAVENAMIAAGAVDTTELAADAVDGTKIADDSVNSEHYVDGSIDTAHIADDQITYAKMGAEFTTSATISASDVDWSAAAVHTKTLTANTTLTFSNVSTGMVIDLVIDGNYTLTLPASVKEISGTYDGTVTNLIQIVSTNGATEQWATISKEA